jgi:hypothetical protein
MHQRILKRLAFATFLSAMVFNVHAVAPGLYMGFSTGPATNTGNEQVVQTFGLDTTTAKPRSTQWGTGVLVGYKINQWVAAELGADLFAKIKYTTPGNIDTCASPFIRVRDFHIVGKGSFSLSAVEVFGKAGISYIYVTTSGAFNGPFNAPGQPPNQCGKNDYSAGYKPIVAIGVSYDLNQSWVVDGSWTKLLIGGQVKSINFYGLGLSYHFVDRYCGQFLCD